MDSWEHNGLFTRAATNFRIILNVGFSFLSEELKKNGGRGAHTEGISGDDGGTEEGHLLALAQLPCFINCLFLFAKWPCIWYFKIQTLLIFGCFISYAF